MTEPSATEGLRRLPWTGPQGEPEYVMPGDEAEHLADRAEDHTISAARNDAAYALTMADRPETSPEELRRLVRTLAGAVRDVVSVADLREERLNEPVYAPAARAMEEALRAALSQR
ncbi:hypothetical protein ACJWDR_29205 [Streptomyces tauricus]|uniref:hypothetical protein n=1 Tax=Streptomyces tauricus TaxID=68274 RepID=UPI00387F2666